MSLGWVLVQGKVIEGGRPISWLREMKDGKITHLFYKVSNSTVRSLLKLNMIRQSEEDLMYYHYTLTPRGREHIPEKYRI